MAIQSSSVFEIRSTGSSSNGMVFLAGSGRTDYSQQDSPQLTLTDVVTNGTTTVTSATGGFTTAMVGNGINIAGTVYQITARNSATNITVDRNATTGTGQTGKVGGAGASLVDAATALGSSAGTPITIYVRGTFSQSSNATFTTGVNTVAIIGYSSVRGDGGRATITAASGCTRIIDFGAYFNGVSFINLDANGIADYCVYTGSNGNHVRNCKLSNFLVAGFTGNSHNIATDCEVTGGVSGATAGFNSIFFIDGCHVHDNACTGVVFVGGGDERISNSLIVKNTGATSDGVSSSYNFNVTDCTISDNGRDGIRASNSNNRDWMCRRNLITYNGGHGINYFNGPPNSTLGNPNGNAFIGNTSGAVSDALLSGANDITLTADPYTNKAGGDYTLNLTAGGGAAVRAAGIPVAFGSMTSYRDVGALQHQDSGGGGGSTFMGRGVLSGGRL